jgi:hypothetical protein
MDNRRGRRFLPDTGCGILRGVVLFACMTAALVLPGFASAGAPDVAALQVALRIRGTYSGGIDGIFGPETQAAVRRFQRGEGLLVDGDPGPRTRAAFGPFGRHRLGSRLIRSRRFGWDVAALQYLLVRCGFSVGAIDGFFGPRTRTVVVRYQHRTSLSVDGVAGAATTAALRRALGCRELKGTVPSGVTVSGVGIGGLSGDWASIALRSAFAEPLHLGAHGRGWLADPNEFARAEVATAVRRALHAHAGEDVPLRVAVERRRIRRYAARIDSRLCRPPVPARLMGLRSLRPSISRAHAGCHVRRVQFIRAVSRVLIRLERSVIQVPMKRVRPPVTRANFGPVIVIHRNSHRLYLYQGVKLVRALRVGTGRLTAPTPVGRFRIVTKARNPWWYPPAAGWATGANPIPPGPGNPLGTRWMGLSVSEVGIHGTPDAASVGYSRSHGCVRMYRHQAEWLFRRVRIGTPVIIVPA